MNIKELNEALSRALRERKLNEEEICIDDVVEAVCNSIRSQFDKDDNISLDTWITEELDGYFGYMDDVIELFKEIAAQNESIYSDVSDCVWGELVSRIEDKLEDLKGEELEESVKVKKSNKKNLKEDLADRGALYTIKGLAMSMLDPFEEDDCEQQLAFCKQVAQQIIDACDKVL